MRFFLEVELPDADDANATLVQILRDCADDLVDLVDLEPGDKQDIHDPAANRVGSWSVSADAP
ncbi:hypothetical protein [Mycolicibacterium chubuense]|uniref:hypothetical protein n=1 Tax=Mycolicibacterium chubuense TaxID=1800 RepID=UPI001301858C|nr:hypothetical protein [Mycolicibacterium chubuense]